MITLSLVLGVIIGILAIIDWKFKEIPSVFLTGIIFLTAMVHFYNFEVGLISLAFGSLAFIYAWTLYEAQFIGGIADVKIITIIGLMIVNVQMFFVLMMMVILFGMAYKLTFRYILKREKTEEIPFIPCLYAVYIAMLLVGGLA